MTDTIESLQLALQAGKLSRREFLHRVTALGITGALTRPALGASASAPVKGGKLVVGLGGGGSTDSLDPATYAAQVCNNLARWWGETLTELHPSGSGVVPVLAESYETLDNSTTWRLKLREDVIFHNGQPMTSDDVVKSLQRHSDERAKSAAFGIMRGVKRIVTDGPHAVILTLTEANADLPYLLTEYHLIIQPGGGFDAPAAGCGSGPYTIEVAEHGVRYFFKKFPDHWRPEVGHVDSIELLVVNDQTARASALQSGRVHMINLVDAKTARLLGRHPRVSIENTAGRAHYVFYMRTDTPPFDNVDLRLALKYAIDRDEMVKRVLHGFGTLGNDFPINAGYPLFPDDIPQRSYDPEKAAYHYKKSGHSGPIVLRTSAAAFSGAVDAAALFQQHAARAGIELTIRREPADGWWTNVWNVQPFVASYWGGRPVQDQQYSLGYKSDADWNETRWVRPEFDRLLVQARSESDAVRRKALYRQMAMMVRDDGGEIVSMFNDFIDAIGSNVQGYIRDPGAELSNGFGPIRCWLT